MKNCRGGTQERKPIGIAKETINKEQDKYDRLIKKTTEATKIVSEIKLTLIMNNVTNTTTP